MVLSKYLAELKAEKKCYEPANGPTTTEYMMFLVSSAKCSHRLLYPRFISYSDGGKIRCENPLNISINVIDQMKLDGIARQR